MLPSEDAVEASVPLERIGRVFLDNITGLSRQTQRKRGVNLPLEQHTFTTG